MLTRVRFAGIKSLRDVTVDLDPFTVLVGPNGCGKSTFLDQMERVCVASAPDANYYGGHALGWNGTLLSKHRLAAERTTGFSGPMEWSAVADGALQFTLSVPPEPRGNHYLVSAVTIRTPDAELTISNGANSESVQQFDDQLRSRFSWRSQRLALVPWAIRRPCEMTADHLEPSGYGLGTVLKDLAANHTQRYLELQEALRSIVPHFREIRLGKDAIPAADALSESVPVTTLELVMSQGRIPAHQVSDGTLLALAVLTAAHNPDQPSLLLIDDLDHGLHLRAQYAMVKALRAAMRSRPDLQVVCTTHSPFMFEDIEGEEVRVMALDAQGYTRVRRLTEHPDYARWRTAMTSGEVWANVGEDWVVDG